MTIPPFQPALKDGRIYGRGTCDMKGSTAALLAALTPQRVASLQDRDVQVMVVGTPDEECGVKGAEALSRSGLRADAAVVLEPTRNIPVVAHKGAHWADIVLKGKSGHGSQPASGISTHVALAHLLPRLLEFQEHCAKEYTHPLLGSSTLNIGQITGGITYNIIPDQTCIRIDRRRIPNEPAREFDGAVRDLLEELVRRNLLLEASMTVVSDTPAFATRPDSPLVIRLTDAIETITGQRPAPEGTSWVSDASPFSRVCDEILVFGPGDIAQAHTEDEFIEEASLHEGTRILGAFLDAYGLPT